MVASILDFLVHKKYTLTLIWDENFFSFIRSNRVSKNPSFHTDFKIVHVTLVKSAPKKSFAQKMIFWGLFSIGKIVFWLKLFLGALFTRVICTFLKSVRKDRFFDDPFDLFKEKKCSSLRRDNELFWELKRSKMEETAQNFEKRLFINRS